jgi:hypothetical protein
MHLIIFYVGRGGFFKAVSSLYKGNENLAINVKYKGALVVYCILLNQTLATDTLQ